MCRPRWTSSSSWSRPSPSSSRSGGMVSAVRRSATSNTSSRPRSTLRFTSSGTAVAEVGDLARHADQPPQQGVLLDDGGVVLGVGDRGRVGLQRDEDRGVAHRVEHARALELVGDGHRVGGLTALHERRDGAEDVPVGGLVEVLGPSISMPADGGVVREQHGPEEGLLGLEVVGGQAATRGGQSRCRAERVGDGCRRRLGPWLPYSDGSALGNG